MIEGVTGFGQFSKRKGVMRHTHKFGSNNSLGVTPQSIWSVGGLYPWASLDTASLLYIASDDTNDAGSSVAISGLDENWAPLTESVTLAGSPAQATTTNTFKRVFRLEFSNGNTGEITAKVTSYAGVTVAAIEALKSQSLMAIYSVPEGHSAYFMNYTIGTGKGDDASVDLFFRQNGQPFRIKDEAKVYQTSFTMSFPIPLVLGPKTDIDLRAVTTNAGGGACNANFDILLYKYDK